MPDTPALIERLERGLTYLEPRGEAIGLVQAAIAALRSDPATIAGLREQVRALREAVRPITTAATDAGFRGDGWQFAINERLIRELCDAYAATESETP